MQIDARFLGPTHDRYIELTYSKISFYEIRNSPECALSARQVPHGDLLVHELRLVKDGLFAHELLFSNGSVFLTEFSDFAHRIVMRDSKT
jgi:hypothetical protein